MGEMGHLRMDHGGPRARCEIVKEQKDFAEYVSWTLNGAAAKVRGSMGLPEYMGQKITLLLLWALQVGLCVIYNSIKTPCLVVKYLSPWDLTQN